MSSLHHINPLPSHFMRRSSVGLWIGAVALVGVATGCGSSGTGPGGRTSCNPPLSIGPSTFDESSGTINVQYTATQTGDGTITSLTYAGPSGNVVVNNPTFPYSVTTTVPLPAQASMSASAFFTNGTITIAYSANVGGGDVEATNQTCGGGNM